MLYGSQKRFDKNGDGKLKGAEWQRWYQYAYGDEIEAKETRRRANAAAEQKRAQIAADFADHVSDLINCGLKLIPERAQKITHTLIDLLRLKRGGDHI